MAATTTTTTSSTPLIELDTATTVPVKLDSTNYPTLFKQTSMLLAANNLLGYVNGTIECLPAKLGSGDDATDIFPFN